MKKKTILAACIKKKILFEDREALDRHLQHLAKRRIESVIGDVKTEENGNITVTITEQYNDNELLV